jgi:hypothetical protein
MWAAVATIATLGSVLLAVISLVYAWKIARESRAQREVLENQIAQQKQHTKELSDLTTTLGRISLNSGECDQFTLRTLASLTRSKPVVSLSGAIAGYDFVDEHGSARLRFREDDHGRQVVDVMFDTRQDEEGSQSSVS